VSLLTVTVTWLDGRQEIYTCNQTRIRDGVLYLLQDHYPASDEPNRMIPLDGLREWSVPS